MNGWQRFGLLILGCVITALLFPDFEAPGWSFLLFMILGGTAAILVLSVISNMFAIYRFETLNKLITLIIIGVIAYILLWYFPLTNYKAPIYQIQAGRNPTQNDIKRGLKRLTFNFDFVHRNVHRDENYSNQELKKNKPKDAKAPAGKPRHTTNENIPIGLDE